MGRPVKALAASAVTRLYVEQRLSLRETAGRLGVSRAVLVEWLRWHGHDGYPVRDRSAARRRRTELERSEAERRCAHSTCSQPASEDRWCTYHFKRVKGLIR